MPAGTVEQLKVGDKVLVALSCSFTRLIAEVKSVANGKISVQTPSGYWVSYHEDTWIDYGQTSAWAGFIERKASQEDIEVVTKIQLCESLRNKDYCDWNKLTLEQLQTISDMIGK